MSIALTNAQGIGKIIFESREEKERQTDFVVSPFGGINAVNHRPSTTCSLFDSLGLSTAVHPAPTYLEPYTGTKLASTVAIGACAYTLFFLREKAKFSLYFMWFVCVWMFVVSTKSLSVGNGVLAHQMGVTASGVVCIGALCKIFMDVVYAGGFGDAATAATVHKPTSSPYEPIYTKMGNNTSATNTSASDAAANVPSTSPSASYAHIDRTSNVVGGVTADEAAAALRAELAAKGSRRIITDSDVKRRMELMNTEYLKRQYEVATKKARSDLAAQITASSSQTALLEGSVDAPKASHQQKGPQSTMPGTGKYSLGTGKSSAPTSTYNHLQDATIYLRRVYHTGKVLGRYLRRNPLLKASALAAGLTFYNFRRLEWWGMYVPELRSLKGRDNSTSGIDVYKGTYSAEIDADILNFARTHGSPKVKG